MPRRIAPVPSGRASPVPVPGNGRGDGGSERGPGRPEAAIIGLTSPRVRMAGLGSERTPTGLSDLPGDEPEDLPAADGLRAGQMPDLAGGARVRAEGRQPGCDIRKLAVGVRQIGVTEKVRLTRSAPVRSAAVSTPRCTGGECPSCPVSNTTCSRSSATGRSAGWQPHRGGKRDPLTGRGCHLPPRLSWALRAAHFQHEPVYARAGERQDSVVTVRTICY